MWEFREARDWAQFHHPKELASALSIEVSEIMELFRFQSPEQVAEKLKGDEFRQAMGDELADTLFLLLLLPATLKLTLRPLSTASCAFWKRAIP